MSDFSALHRIADPLSLPSPRFFALAQYLPAYAGAVQAAMRVQMSAVQPQPVLTEYDPHVPAGAVINDDVAAVAAMSQRGGGEFPGIEYVGG